MNNKFWLVLIVTFLVTACGGGGGSSSSGSGSGSGSGSSGSAPTGNFSGQVDPVQTQ